MKRIVSLLSNLDSLIPGSFPTRRRTQAPYMDGHFHVLWNLQLKNDVTFTAERESGETAVVKFVSRYGLVAHKVLAVAGMALQLHYFLNINSEDDMTGGYHEGLSHRLYEGPLKMIVMEYIHEKRFKGDLYPVDVKASIRKAITTLHAEGLVHGDLRPPNVIVSEDHKALLSDFDWVGKEDVATYPLALSSQIRWHRDVEALALLKEHDIGMLEKMF